MAGILVPITVLVFVACLAVGLRLYTRFGIIRNAGLDEYLIGASLIMSLVWYFLHVGATHHGFGRPITEIEPHARRWLLKAVWFGPAAWGLSSALCKLSVVWQYRRVFPTPGATRLCNGLMCVLVVYGLFSLFGAVFRCWPVTSMWDLPLAGTPGSTARCMNIAVFNYICSGTNILMDLVIFAIPVPLVNRLHISRRQKRALVLVFTFGGFVIIASVIRLIALEQYVTAADPSGPVVRVALWSGIEINISITCACLAVLRPLLSSLFPRLLPSSACSGSGANGGEGILPSCPPSSSYARPRKKGKEQQKQQRQLQNPSDASDGGSTDANDQVLPVRLLQQKLVRQGPYTPAARCFAGGIDVLIG
ncbi:PTH11-like integral membrane protein [Apiospora sp. TS-2023a]